MKKFCCKEFEKEVKAKVERGAQGLLYPVEAQHEAALEQDQDGLWHVVGCCGTCWVLNIFYCPFCGEKL